MLAEDAREKELESRLLKVAVQCNFIPRRRNLHHIPRTNAANGEAASVKVRDGYGRTVGRFESTVARYAHFSLRNKRRVS